RYILNPRTCRRMRGRERRFRGRNNRAHASAAELGSRSMFMKSAELRIPAGNRGSPGRSPDSGRDGVGVAHFPSTRYPDRMRFDWNRVRVADQPTEGQTTHAVARVAVFGLGILRSSGPRWLPEYASALPSN